MSLALKTSDFTSQLNDSVVAFTRLQLYMWNKLLMLYKLMKSQVNLNNVSMPIKNESCTTKSN